jgi:hypothetical protein
MSLPFASEAHQHAAPDQGQRSYWTKLQSDGRASDCADRPYGRPGFRISSEFQRQSLARLSEDENVGDPVKRIRRSVPVAKRTWAIRKERSKNCTPKLLECSKVPLRNNQKMNWTSAFTNRSLSKGA